ncbi:MAG: alanine:cation symporter family protein [Bacteriovoracaceae bacterium]
MKWILLFNQFSFIFLKLKFTFILILFVFIGAVSHLQLVSSISDAVYGLLAIPNLIGTFLLLNKAKNELN